MEFMMTYNKKNLEWMFAPLAPPNTIFVLLYKKIRHLRKNSAYNIVRQTKK